jgi:hypothetical protein
MSSIIRFYSTVFWLGVSLALLGQLKSCTMTMMGLAAGSSETGIMSYSKFTRSLYGPGPLPAKTNQ